MQNRKKVHITEVAPRDGFQMERKFIPTETKIRITNALLRCGFKKIEATSFISPKAIPQMKDAGKLIAGLDRSTGAIISALVPNKKGAENAAKAGVDEMMTFLSASESHNKSNVNRSIEESLQGLKSVFKIAKMTDIEIASGIGVAFGCPFEGDVQTEKVVGIVERLLDMGTTTITLGDTTGMGTPPIVRETCEELLKRFNNIDLSLHFHNTRGIGLVNVYAALDLGLTKFESTVGGLGGCPFAPGATGNICTEDLVYLFHEMGIDTGVDLDKLIEVSKEVEVIIGRTLPGQLMKAGKRNKLVKTT